MSSREASPVSVVTASAGTGKTYFLTARIRDAVAAGRRPERILASTFTVKAAEELRERAREQLIASGDAEGAVRLLGARIGTINGVSGGLVREFAFGLGLSPIVDVIDENAARSAFIRSADQAIGAYADELGTQARIFAYDGLRRRKDWRDDVAKIVEFARANNLPQGALAEFAERSVAGFHPLLREPLPGETAASLDGALRDAVSALLDRDPASFGGGKKITKDTLKALDILRDFSADPIERQPWQKWAKLSKLEVGAADRETFGPTVAAAAAFPRHPRLFEQVARYIRGVFACAARAMADYEAFKRAWGLVDFVDQDRLALELVGQADLLPQLRERVQSVFVDEFQDTSPLQLAVFVGLSQIAESSMWVGDPKQSIYSFRGTDPDLIAKVAQDVRRATDGDDVTLGTNYRSRPGLVGFFNDAFARTFQNAGLPASAARIDEVDRSDLPGQSTPLAVWRLAGRTIGARLEAIAAGVAAATAADDDWLVADDGFARPLAAGDVAVLCRNNDDCLALASAVARRELKVAIEREGLFGTLEARLATAALRWCADLRDSVALAEMAHLLHDGDDQPRWFEASLLEGRDAIEALVPLAGDLREVSETGIDKTPLEFFDAVLAHGVGPATLRWGRADERLLNLEQLRALVVRYQDERDRDRAPTTVTDLCAWLAEQEAKQPKSRATDAVTVDTYHGSKGLEWPFVVLSDLDEEPKASPFGAHVMSDRTWDRIDWRNPLEGRWVRFWPWPFGPQRDNVGLDATASSSPEGRAAERIEQAERVRLLYVGATRARDYLALAVPDAKPGLAWLDELKGDDGASAVRIPSAGATSMTVNGREHPVRVFALAAAPDGQAEESSLAYAGATGVSRAYQPLAIRPSAEGVAEDAKIVAEVDLGARLPMSGSPDMNLVGEALHRFLAADDPALPEKGRIQMAARLLEAWGVSAFDPRDVVTMSDRFRRFVASTWPGSILRPEAPIVQRIGDRTLRGRLDAVVEADSEIVIIDHKSFPGGRRQWIDQARKHAGQMRSYRDAVRAATSSAKPVRMALHLPISGEVLFVE